MEDPNRYSDENRRAREIHDAVVKELGVDHEAHLDRMDAVAAERTRLEKIVIEQQTELDRLSRKLDSLQVDYAARGETNARLNKDLQRCKRLNPVAWDA